MKKIKLVKFLNVFYLVKELNDAGNVSIGIKKTSIFSWIGIKTLWNKYILRNNTPVIVDNTK